MNTAVSRPCVAVFDLDGTLTWHDTLLPFLAGYLARHPSRWLRLWRVPAALLRYAVARYRGELKSRVIVAVLGGLPLTAIDSWADRFVHTLKQRRRFRPKALACLEAHQAAGDHIVLLSASPDLYVPRIGDLLQAEKTTPPPCRQNVASDPAHRQSRSMPWRSAATPFIFHRAGTCYFDARQLADRIKGWPRATADCL